MAYKQSLLALSLLVTSALGSHVHSQIVNYFTNPIFRGRADPIVQPGEAAGHVHLVFGGGGFNLAMTQNQAVDANCTANNIHPDKSNYWMPDLWFQAPNGSFFPVQAREYKVYYNSETSDDDIKPFPIGIHMVAGDSMQRSPPGPEGHNIDPNHGTVIPYEIQCVGSNVTFIDAKCTNYGGLRSNIYFPQCYNPAAGLTNYKNNTAYASSAGTNNGVNCPEGWVHMPQLNLEVYWDVHVYDDDWTAGIGKQPWRWSNGDATGAGVHADFVGGWETAALQDLIDHCDSPASFGNGAMSDCYPSEITTAAEGGACTVASPIDEQITGELSALPGCNPISFGPERAVAPATCNATTKISRPTTPHSDFTETKQWQYYGCYTDAYNNDRLFSTGLPDVQTIEQCIDQCAAKGYSMAGLEYATQCYCSNSLAESNGNGVPSALCGTPCAGDRNEICGGSNLLSVYQKCSSSASCVNGVGPFADGDGSYVAVSGASAASSAAAVAAPSKTTTAAATPSKATTSVAPTKVATSPAKPASTKPAASVISVNTKVVSEPSASTPKVTPTTADTPKTVTVTHPAVTHTVTKASAHTITAYVTACPTHKTRNFHAEVHNKAR